MLDNQIDARRSKAKILADILRLIQRKGGIIKPTHILYGANLSHKRLTNYLDWLISEGFIEEIGKSNRKLYKLSDKGQTFIVEFRKIEKISEAFGISI